MTNDQMTNAEGFHWSLGQWSLGHSLPLWVLRVTLLLQALGVSAALLFAAMEQESDIYGLLYFDWAWSERTAQQVEDYGTIGYLIAAALVVVASRIPGNPACWQAPLLAYVFFWQLLVAVTATARGGQFMSELILPEQMVRYACPLALITLLPWNGSESLAPRRCERSRWLLRVAAATTFAAHGIKATCLAPSFVNLIMGTFPSLSEDTAGHALRIIGLIDIALAVLILSTRWQTVAWYMAAWGLITALSRMTALGLAAYPDVLYRAANCGVPLAIALSWRVAVRNRTCNAIGRLAAGRPRRGGLT